MACVEVRSYFGVHNWYTLDSSVSVMKTIEKPLVVEGGSVVQMMRPEVRDSFILFFTSQIFCMKSRIK